MDENTSNLAKIFKALADENRLKILVFIYKRACKCEENQLSCQNGTCIKDLSETLDVTTPTISHHIKGLVNAGLIITEKQGKWVYCKINQRMFKKACNFLSEFLTEKHGNCKKFEGARKENKTKEMNAK